MSGNKGGLATKPALCLLVAPAKVVLVRHSTPQSCLPREQSVRRLRSPRDSIPCVSDIVLIKFKVVSE